ncbi:MAG TPA: phosphatidylserine decarboxylase family protein [Terriglobales bacterium]
MVRDGYYYGLSFIAVALLLGWYVHPVLAVFPLLLAVFFLWFFRDPERRIPAAEGAIVSPGDGKVTDVCSVPQNGEPCTRISIFLNVFNVHVNRSPIEGIIADVNYKRGKFGNAMGAISAEQNEQNVVTVRGDTGTVVFKQIAGLLARRIVFNKKIGDHVARGERVGLIKFGSRVDVIFPAGSEVKVKVGDHVAGGSSVLAVAQARSMVSSSRDVAEAR